LYFLYVFKLDYLLFDWCLGVREALDLEQGGVGTMTSKSHACLTVAISDNMV